MKPILFFISLIVLISLISFKTPPLRVLFVGDSLTCYSSGWQHQVSKSLGNTYTNLSVGGKRLEWMKFTLDNHLKRDSMYSSVYIYGGCNDAFSYVDLRKSLKYTQDMVDTCNSRGIRPIVVLGWDPKRVMKKTVYGETVTIRARTRYVELQKIMLAELKNCKIIPVDTTVTFGDAGDGVHLGATGHRKFAQWVLNHL